MRLALIGTFYRRWERTEELLRRVAIESTYRPDEFWLMCEDGLDVDVAEKAVANLGLDYPGLRIVELNTPVGEDGRYSIIPYSNKINYALDRTDADAIVYLDNGSTPHPEKYGLMLRTLEEHPDWGAVWCSFHAHGIYEYTMLPDKGVIEDAYHVLNYTQVMHRPTADRWSLDMELAVPNDVADAWFWRALHASIGPFYPVQSGDLVLDDHHIAGYQASGL